MSGPPADSPPPPRASVRFLRDLALSLFYPGGQWRTASLAYLSFASGLPLGLVWIAIPDWMRNIGVDIRIVGLFTLTQAPWTFKLIWSPLMDRYAPPMLGRRRGWTLVCQFALFLGTLALAGVGHHPDTPWVVAAMALAIAFASASQDIAIDAYAVDILRKEEQGPVVGSRVAYYRAAMYVAGGLSITLAGTYSWPLVNIGLALIYLPMMIITFKAPEPSRLILKPQSLKDAVWYPFLGFLARHRALQILAFVFFYKIADNLADGLLRPFLIDMGYDDFDRGVALATIGLVGIVAGTILGGLFTNAMGLGHSLWVFGVLQIFSNIGYVLVARGDTDRLLMYAALGFEKLTTGLGTGAFSVLLLRMTQKRFSATQYALFSSLFSLPRIVAGPIAGFSVDAVGWEPFFWGTILAGIPGMVLLQRFVPLGVREPHFTVQPPRSLEPLSARQLVARGIAGGGVGFLGGALLSALLAALKSARAAGGAGFDLATAFTAIFQPAGIGDWLVLAGLVIFGAVIGLCTAAVMAARHGAARGLEDETEG